MFQNIKNSIQNIKQIHQNCSKYINFIFLTFGMFIFLSGSLSAQNAKIRGVITKTDQKPVSSATIIEKDTKNGTLTNLFGNFELSVPSNVDITIIISYLGFKTQEIQLHLKSGEISQQNIILEEDFTMLPSAEIVDHSERFVPMVRLDPSISMVIHSVGGFEDILKSLPQVSSNNELSSQYNVRGGNFDENMVFVNDIEIFRPLLTRSGNQEGMSFINSDMVSSVTFSAGGFEAKYGDKMSSVLDIKYKKPNEFGATAYLSLLGAGAHVEGVSKNRRFHFNTGFRYKTTRYLLTSMDTKGSYDPNFLDFQTYMTYDLNEKIEFAFLGNISNNSYKFIPEDRKTAFGTWQNPIGVSMYFEGQEIDKFRNSTVAFSTTWRLNKNLKQKFIASWYNTSEKETFDILTEYNLNELNNSIGESNVGDSVVNIGVGTFLEHARNNLSANIFSVKYIGTFNKNNNNLEWGLQYNFERLIYKINEWNMIDSAGYSLPRSENSVLVYDTDFGNILLNQSQLNAYIQNSYIFDLKKNDISLSGGVRFNYLSFNNEFLISPRLTIAIKPEWEKNVVFRFSTGLYHQPPSFKEIRKLDGTLNDKIKAQSSVHAVLATDIDFSLWDRQFKFSTELFYKYLYNINPYSVDNVRIKYYGENISKGYAAGIEAKINGEFVKGTESWFSIALMNTQEKIEGKYHLIYNDKTNIIDTSYGYVPRPSDQLLNIGIFFQDYIPKNPTWQVNLTFLYGTPLPFSNLSEDEKFSFGRLRSYRRVDLGISKQFVTPTKPLPKGNIFRKFKELWVSLEIFNLLDIDNTISYSWVTSTDGKQYGVPNYLTGRRFNLKITARF
ncbi:MAG: carboxypeptidase-like regulatory domain-containing protein [Bacteroidales bacterium]|jgi:hypothetical protein|nr:carboxypeptidase-like regulatory domain-containing protein [Bacteroidales bacterium]